jgi:hypothetical protein
MLKNVCLSGTASYGDQNPEVEFFIQVHTREWALYIPTNVYVRISIWKGREGRTLDDKLLHSNISTFLKLFLNFYTGPTLEIYLIRKLY